MYSGKAARMDKERHYQSTIAMMLIEMMMSCTQESSKKWLNFLFILKTELMGSPNRLVLS